VLRWPIREGIELRLPEARHADELLQLINANRSRLERWLHWAHFSHTRQDVLNYVETARRDFVKPDFLHFLIFRQSAIAGGCGLILNERANSGEIGYWIDARSEGMGIISDCCRALIGYGFNELELSRVQIRCATGNIRSAAIPKRLGFLHEGTLRQTIRTNDRLDDEHCYGLLRSEWEVISNRQ
jgi:ribosomal-protein-serine acetyltransferase